MKRKTKADRIAEYEAFMGDDVFGVISSEELDKMGFFDAPASTTHHGNYEGGLFDHSLEVAKQLVDLTDKLGLKWKTINSPKVVGMYHDLCKCDAYIKTKDLRFNQYVDVFEYNKETTIDGHGDKSLIFAMPHIKLTDEEIHCIRWHMGAYETDPKRWGFYGRAIAKYPNVLYTHVADMIASHIKGV
jgi:HD superfamily phosphohydrolase YqeK